MVDEEEELVEGCCSAGAEDKEELGDGGDEGDGGDGVGFSLELVKFSDPNSKPGGSKPDRTGQHSTA